MIKRTSEVFILIAKGFCMGAADIVPGVSGGTMAFILGIYEQLINAIRTFGRPKFWQPLLQLKLKAVLGVVEWRFLASVGTGIVLAGLTLARPLEHLLETQPMLLWSFFFGLVAASVVIVAQRITDWTWRRIAALVLGAVFAYFLVGLVPVATPEAPWFLVLCGAIVICAMILPGISGSFLLVLLGKYEFVLSAVNDRDLLPIMYIGIGAVVGLIAFSQVLGWLFAKHHDRTVALLTGLMIGSLRKVWPWKIVQESNEFNILPATVEQLFIGFGAMIVGALVVLSIEYIAHRKSWHS